MSIKSHAFGSVTLTADDAAKFRAQVARGRSGAAAGAGVARGVEASRRLRDEGRIIVKLSLPER